MIENVPLSAAVTVPRESLPLNSSTVLPASAVPSIVGVLSFVNAVVVVITGAAGGVISNTMESGIRSDGEDIFPAASLALTVRL